MRQPTKPCPFCGSSSVELTGDGLILPFSVRCLDCNGQGPGMSTRAQAVANWNRVQREQRLRRVK
jgi:Lar family restriction alleviation protein